MPKTNLRGYPRARSHTFEANGRNEIVIEPINPDHFAAYVMGSPANDNKKPPIKLPTPANDNVPGSKRSRRYFRALVKYLKRAALSGPVQARFVANLANRILSAQRSDLWAQITQQEIVGYTVPKFSLLTNCIGSPINWQGPGSVACLALQAGGDPLGTEINAGQNHVHLAFQYPVFSSTRWDSVEIWERIEAGATSVQPVVNTTAAVVAMNTLRVPVIDPNVIPFGVSVDPQPLPFRLRNKFQKPQPVRARVQQRRLKPYEQPAISNSADFTIGETELTVSNITNNRLATHARVQQGGRGNKEAKFSGKIGAIHSFMVRFGMTPTEWLDFIDSIYAALPGHIRHQSRYHGNLKNRMRAIWENADEIDPYEALYNVGYNHIEDYIVGRTQGKIRDIGAKHVGAQQFARLKGKVMFAIRGMSE